MISEKLIRKLVQEKIEGTEIFAIEVIVKPDNKIHVFVDGEENVSIDDCIDISRHVEHSLDREVEDFELQVSSWGVDQPFIMKRQYEKYVGRNIILKLEDGKKIEGTLVEVKEDSINIQPIIKKGKHKKQKSPEVLLILNEDIKEAKGAISFGK